MAARFKHIVRELLHKEYGSTSKTSHFIYQPQRNYHFKSELQSENPLKDILQPTPLKVTRTKVELGQNLKFIPCITSNVKPNLQKNNCLMSTTNQSIAMNNAQCCSRFYSTASPFAQARSVSPLSELPQNKPINVSYRRTAPFPSFSEVAKRSADSQMKRLRFSFVEPEGVKIKMSKRRHTTSFLPKTSTPTVNVTNSKESCFRYKLDTTRAKKLRRWRPAKHSEKQSMPVRTRIHRKTKQKYVLQTARAYEIPSRNKKELSWPTAYRLWLSKGQLVPQEILNNAAMELASTRCRKRKGKRQKKSVNPYRVTPDDDCMAKLPFHKDGMSYEKTRKSKQVDDKACKRKPKKRLPFCEPGACNNCYVGIDGTVLNLKGITPGIKLEKRPDCDRDETKSAKDCPDTSNICDPRFKPKDPCCEKEKRGHPRPDRPRTFSPKAPNYDKGDPI